MPGSLQVPGASRHRARHRVAFQAARRRLLAVALLLVAAACERPPPPLEVATILQIAAPEQARGHRDRCAVGQEMRAAFGCPEGIHLQPIGEVELTAGRLRQRYRVPPWAKEARAAVEILYRGKDDIGSLRAPTAIVPRLGDELELEFPIEDPAKAGPFEVHARGFRLPAAVRRALTAPVRIGSKATLVGALGLDPIAREANGMPVRVQIVARSTDGAKRVVLLEETLDPQDERSSDWVEHRLDLSELAGKEVVFELRSRAIGAAKDREALAMPLWNPGRIVAPDSRPERPNILLVSLDTLRADYVGAYGQPLPTTPEIDRFAEEAVLFENALAPYPSTTASHMSMLTGLYPSVHGVLAPIRSLAKGIATLAEILSQHGYQTAAVTENAMIDAKNFARGFASYREYKSWSALANDGYVSDGVDDTLAWLDHHAGERFFFFLHTYQVHDPYAPPAAFDLFTADLPADAPESERFRLSYAGEVRYTDGEIGRLLDGLAERGLDEDTIVVLTSDHGEAFGEHGAMGHGLYLIEPVLRVPLLLRAPGLPAGLRIETPVSLVDLTPTLLDLVDVPAPSGLQGLSLLPLLADPESAAYRDRVVYSERGRVPDVSLALRRGDRKWLFETGGRTRIFDLEQDPAEKRPLENAALIEEGRRLAEGFHSQSERLRSRTRPERGGGKSFDAETREKLRRLGYIE